MRGLTKIKEWVNTVLPWAKKDNELIKRANLPWFVKMPFAAGAGWGEIVFTMSDKEVTLDLTRAGTITFVGCDENGKQWKFTTIGVREEVTPP